MDRLEEVKQKLLESDKQSLTMRTQRMAEVIDYDYSIIFSPIDEYLRELDKLYVNGHFMATIIFAGSIVEYLLRKKLILVADYKIIDKATLGTLITIAKRKKVLDKDEIGRLQIIRECWQSAKWDTF